MPHSLNCTCYICYICYWLLLWLPVKKSVFKNGTSAEAPSLSCSCCPLRPSLPAAAGRTPRGRSMLARCSGVRPQRRRSGTRGSRRAVTGGDRWAPGGRGRLRTSTAAPFATRNATTAGWSLTAAQCQRWPVRRIQLGRALPAVAAQVAPDGRRGRPLSAAPAMSVSRRAEEWNWNDDVFFPFFPLWSVSFLLSTSLLCLLLLKFDWIS